MALPSGTYAPRDPAASVLYRVVRDHYDGEGRMLEGALPAPGPDVPHARWEGFDLHAGVTVPTVRASSACVGTSCARR